MGQIPVILVMTFLTFGGFTTASIGRFLPFSGFKPIPRMTPGPINIDISEVKNITTFPLILFINGLEKGLAKNTGYSAEVILDETKTANALIAGVLGFNLYVFRKIRFYWAGSPNGVAATTVNGRDGTGLEVCIYYFNMKYGSFREALNFRDGLVELVFRIKVEGFIPNPLFNPFAVTLKKIKKAGSKAVFPILTSFLFYLPFSPTSSYLVYPSAYVNESTGIMYFCATTIVTSLTPIHVISIPQFKQTFLSLLDYEGKPLINKAEQVPRAGRPIVQSANILKIPNLVKIPSKINESG